MTTTSNPLFQFELPPLPEAQRHAPVDELYKQGFATEGTGKFDLAASYFDEVHKRQPNNPYVLLDLARVYFQLFEIERAKSVLREATQRAGRDADFWYQIALVYQEAHLDQEAEHCFLLARSHGAGNITL